MEQRLKDLHKRLCARETHNRVVVSYSCSRYSYPKDKIYNTYTVHLGMDNVEAFDTIEEMEKHFERDEILFRKF